MLLNIALKFVILYYIKPLAFLKSYTKSLQIEIQKLKCIINNTEGLCIRFLRVEVYKCIPRKVIHNYYSIFILLIQINNNEPT